MSIESTTSWRNAPKSDETKVKISEGKKGIPMPNYLIEEQSYTWNTILPLVMRNAAAFEIEEVTGLRRAQIHGSINNHDRKLGRFEEYYDEKKVKDRKKRTYTRVLEKKWHKFPTQEQKNMIDLARQIFKSGQLNHNLQFWEITQAIAGRAQVNWFDSFAKSVVMEGYIRAKVKEMHGDRGDMEAYLVLGRVIDNDWFNSWGHDRDIARTALYEAAGIGSVSSSK